VNANDEAQSFTMSDTMDQNLKLHIVQGSSVDPVVKMSTFNTGTFVVPGRTTAVFVLYESTEGLIDDLIAQIEDLVEDGVLNRGQGNSLIVKLEGALKKYIKGNSKVAINRLNAFINEVSSLADEGVLPDDIASGLIWDAEIIIASIE
jgi:hypothetical protein